jgi:hypothetical protein
MLVFRADKPFDTRPFLTYYVPVVAINVLVPVCRPDDTSG